MRSIKPFGTWPSPLAPDDLAAASIQRSLPRVDGADILWIERRPAEGRAAIVRRRADGTATDVIEAPFSARSRVHEYGGGEYAAAGGRVIFINDADQDLYLAIGGASERLTRTPDSRFADMTFDPAGDRVLTVVERACERGAPPQNTIAAVPLGGPRAGDVLDLLAGRDFYASPRPSPDGDRLAWLAWDLPHMPWQAAELWLGEIAADGAVVAPRRIAGGDGDGIFQPEWARDGGLYFIADRGGWSNLHVWRDGEVAVVVPLDAELGRPQWAFGMTSYAVLEPGRLLAACWREGAIEIGVADERAGTWQRLDTDFTRVDDVAAGEGAIAINGGDDFAPPSIHPIDRATLDVRITAAPAAPLRHEDVSRPRTLAVPAEGGTVHALYYPPANRLCEGEEGARPPLVVAAHGGPTGMARRGFVLDRQFWTTRGFAFLDVDYRGSTGYGRAYREALDGRWGERDADDAIAAARFAAEAGLADPAAMVIRGSSAGGLTVLNALIRSDIFAGGASYYGVTDLERLAAETHKFESGYLDALIGGTVDAIPDVYRARSPVHHADRITAPVIFLQGLDDAVVPPSQSHAMARSLESRGVAVALLEFEGEGHGFRRAETIRRALAAEHAFYARILRLRPEEELADVQIRNFGTA